MDGIKQDGGDTLAYLRRPCPQILKICDKLTSALNGERIFWEIVLITLNNGPTHKKSGFFVARRTSEGLLEKVNLIGRNVFSRSYQNIS